ncbi:MAG: 3'(2'),5'-bisphosphate nucleotidase CysQ [Rhodomicrobium sp.]
MTLEASDYKDFALSAVVAAQQAGAAIMDIYNRQTLNVRYKADSSPVTDADHASEDIVIAALSKLMPGIPVIAEEQASAGNIPDTGATFFLVDPLDGTKEFLKFNGEFTINIGLVRERKAVFGLIYAPAKADCYVTLSPGKAFRCALRPAAGASLPGDLSFVPLDGEAAEQRPFTAIVSRSHVRPETLAFLAQLGEPARTVLGSSLKLGVLARGEADVYPRFGPTSEWDTAAGQAILEATGGCVVTADGEPLLYGKKDGGYLNPSFIAWRRPGGPNPA